jgi:hypothetical protein
MKSILVVSSVYTMDIVLNKKSIPCHNLLRMFGRFRDMVSISSFVSIIYIYTNKGFYHFL